MTDETIPDLAEGGPVPMTPRLRALFALMGVLTLFRVAGLLAGLTFLAVWLWTEETTWLAAAGVCGGTYAAATAVFAAVASRGERPGRVRTH